MPLVGSFRSCNDTNAVCGIKTPLIHLIQKDIHRPAQTAVVRGLARAVEAALQKKGLFNPQGTGGKLEEDFISSRYSPVSSAAPGPLGFPTMDQSSLPFNFPSTQNPIVAVPPGRTQTVSPGEGATNTSSPFPLHVPHHRGRSSHQGGGTSSDPR